MSSGLQGKRTWTIGIKVRKEVMRMGKMMGPLLRRRRVKDSCLQAMMRNRVMQIFFRGGGDYSVNSVFMR